MHTGISTRKGAKTVPNPLTDTALRAAKAGQTLWDSSLKGFGVRIGKNRKTFIVLVASGRRHSIGHYPTISLADARTEAKRQLAEKTLGRLVPNRTAFETARDDFLADCKKRIRPSTLKQYSHQLVRHFPFGRKNIVDITPREIIRELNKLTPSQKEHAARVGKTFFKWAVGQHLIDINPMERITVPQGTSRERVLTNDELKAIYRTARNGQTTFHRIVSLLILTGQRRGEIAQLQWEWIKDNTITIPASVTKNKVTHAFPVSDTVKDILDTVPKLSAHFLFPAERMRRDTTTVFNGWGKPKARFDTECGVSDWTLHDIRRTFSTNWAALGVAQIVTEKYINHVTGGSQSPVSQIYNRHAYFDEMAAAADQWSEFLHSLLRD